MKIIHTSDWHIGQIFNEYERTEEHLAFFRTLAGITAREKPDALLVSGDIFHNPLPSAQSQKMYADAILGLKEASPGTTVVITAGNHDSGSRLEVFKELWDMAGVKVVGCLSRKAGRISWKDHVIRVPHASSLEKTAGYIVALPHIYRQNYPVSGEACENVDSGYARQEAFYRKMLATVMEENTEGLPVVLMAHLAVAGSTGGGQEDFVGGQQDSVGGLDYTPCSIFPDGFAYLALGHIHHPQTVGRKGKDYGMGKRIFTKGKPVARYCGSPVPLSFDEDYGHSISVVEMEEDGKVTVREEPVPCMIPVLTIPENPVPFSDALEALESFPDDRQAYIRLNVLIDDFLPQNATMLAMKAAEGKACRYCSMKVTRVQERGTEKSWDLTAEEIKASGPLDVARLYFRNRYGKELDSGMADMLSEVIGEVQRNMKED